MLAHEILPSLLSHIIVLRLYRELEVEDMQQDDHVSNNNNMPICILIGKSDMAAMLSPNFLDHVRSSITMDDNLGHIAFCTRSAPLSALVRVVGRLTGRDHKLSVHRSQAKALDHLLKLHGGKIELPYAQVTG